MRFILVLFFLTFTSISLAEDVRFISLNVYFDDTSGQERYPQILDSLAKGKYQVICLQECTSLFLDLLKKRKDFEDYQIVKGISLTGYCSVILVRGQVRESSVILLPTRMGRSAPCVVIQKLDLLIVNVHLESGLHDSGIRKKQLQAILRSATEYRHVLIAGDCNFVDNTSEESVLSGYTDLGKQDGDVTYDIQNNALAKKTKFPEEESRRQDRLYLKSPSLVASGYTVRREFKSDHYGVEVRIARPSSSHQGKERSSGSGSVVTPPVSPVRAAPGN